MAPMAQLLLHGIGDPGQPAAPGAPGALAGFHPAVAEWFRRRFPDGPTAPAVRGLAHIAAGRDTLIAAPTGSGKTLAGFLVGIDRLLPRPRRRRGGRRTSRASSTSRR